MKGITYILTTLLSLHNQPVKRSTKKFSKRQGSQMRNEMVLEALRNIECGTVAEIAAEADAAGNILTLDAAYKALKRLESYGMVRTTKERAAHGSMVGTWRLTDGE